MAAKKEGLVISKSQINYWREKIEAATTILLRRSSSEHIMFPEIPQLTQEEKLVMIYNGTAKMKVFDSDHCLSVKFLNAFEYPGEDIIEKKCINRGKAFEKARIAIQAEAEAILDCFVMDKFKTHDEIREKISAFFEKWYKEQPY